MKLGCHLTAKNAAQFNHNKGIRLDACQRMKSANGFFEEECCIIWNLSSVGGKRRAVTRQK